MSNLSRRQLLAFFGASAGTAVLAPALGGKLFGGDSSVAEATESLSFIPVRLPHTLPIYQKVKSFLPTGINQRGKVLNPDPVTRLLEYRVFDDVVVPPEYERYVIVSWGDRVFPNKEDYFGYNNDFTAFIPIKGSLNDGYLWVNHEYVSYPISIFVPDLPEDLIPAGGEAFPTSFPIVVGYNPNAKDRTLLGEFLYNVGGSVVRIASDDRNGRYRIIRDPQNRRIHGLSGLGLNAQRTDGYQAVAAWGGKSYQKGDLNYLLATGPAAKQVFPLSSDGLGDKIIGTIANCSGGTTPWGTILSAEENFQGSETFFVGVTEPVVPNGTQVGYIEGTVGAEFGLVGEKYGWMVEIDLGNPDFRPRKHTALGRFRHENITMRVEDGKKLVAYMGDDRRGGHTYKFVSKDTVSNRKAQKNTHLLENGTLYVARYNPPTDLNPNPRGTGEWIPLQLDTKTNPIPPSVLASEEIAAIGNPTRNGLILLPRRQGLPNEEQIIDGGALGVTVTKIVDEETGEIESFAESEALPGYRNKRVSDFYTSQGAVLVDAFLASNLVGGTPTARPEDLEVNPRNPREVFIAYTDGAPGSDGYPDSRIFIVSKYSRDINEDQPSGSLFKIIEDSSDSTGTTFHWERYAKGGEAGTEHGDGFANVDNLAFDKEGNIWGVTDMSTSTHNGFDLGAAAEPFLVEHTVVGAESTSEITSNQNVETSNLTAVFGNNWLFYIPMKGPFAGEVIPFAYGPMRCEMTGPTFIGDDTLIISVQHPGEDVPFSPQKTLTREIEILGLEGEKGKVNLFMQERTVPRGSNWPSNIQGIRQGPPRPSVLGIRRKESKGRFI